jgi:hypothetical protein
MPDKALFRVFFWNVEKKYREAFDYLLALDTF